MSELYIQRSRRVAYRRLGQETIVMSSADATLFSLNEVASAIWESADGQKTLAEIVRQRVCEEFEVEPERALHDAEELVHGLAARGILLVSDQPLPSGSSAAGASR